MNLRVFYLTRRGLSDGYEAPQTECIVDFIWNQTRGLTGGRRILRTGYVIKKDQMRFTGNP